MKSYLIFFFVFLVIIPQLFAQDVEVFGTIKGPNDEPLQGVRVQSQSSSRFVLSSAKGYYWILTDKNDILTFSIQTHQEYKISINSLSFEPDTDAIEVNVIMHPKVDLFDLSLEELMRIEIVSVSKRTEKLSETPQTAMVITADDIRMRGYTDLEQIFHDLPGFDISRGYGTEYSQIYQRGYRSNNTDRTLFLIDGVEENDLWSGSAWIGKQYPLNQIKQIEIMYGPATTIYGPNAFLGTVNIVTKDASEIVKQNRSVGASVNLAYGSWNTKFTDIALAATNEDISFVISGRLYLSDEMDLSNYNDWNYSLEPYTIDYYKDVLGTQSNEVASIAQQLDYQGYYYSPSLNGVAPKFENKTENYYLYGRLRIRNLTIGFQTFKRSEGYGAWYTDMYELGTAHDCRWVPQNSFFYVKYQESITEKLSITSFTTFRRHGIDGESKELFFYGYLNGEYDITGLVNNSGELLPEDQRRVPYWWEGYFHTHSMQLRSELRFDHELSDRLNFIYGTEYRNSHIQGEYLLSNETIPEETGKPVNMQGGNHFYSYDFGLFAQANFKPHEDLLVVAGGRFDKNKIRKTGGYGSVFNPKLAVIYSPNSYLFKAVYSQAFKDADFFTKFGTTPGRLLNNPGLLPEKVKNLDISAGWQISSSLYYDVVGYHARYDGVVGTADVTFIDEEGNTVSTTQHQALGSLSISGLQSNMILRTRNYSTYINYTFTNPYNTTEDEMIRIGDIASHQVNMGVNITYWQRSSISLRANWVGRKETGASTTISSNPLSSIDPYFVLNGAADCRIWDGVFAQVSLFNILNNEYFHPGVRSANGTYYAARLPQYERHLFIKLIFEI